MAGMRHDWTSTHITWFSLYNNPIWKILLSHLDMKTGTQEGILKAYEKRLSSPGLAVSSMNQSLLLLQLPGACRRTWMDGAKQGSGVQGYLAEQPGKATSPVMEKNHSIGQENGLSYRDKRVERKREVYQCMNIWGGKQLERLRSKVGETVTQNERRLTRLGSSIVICVTVSVVNKRDNEFANEFKKC